VAVGASAGGLEPLGTFFSAVPSDLGIAYLVVMHIPPDHDSNLVAIIERFTEMPVQQIDRRQRTKLQPDSIYVIAPGHDLTITDGSICAPEIEQKTARRVSIDVCFQSLAKHRDDCYGVLLSGSGSDGTDGARAIKVAGGLMLVQDPREAEYIDMPQAAIAAGVADIVLPARQLAERLGDLVRNRQSITAAAERSEQPGDGDETEEQHLDRTFALLQKTTGHDFSGYKRGTKLRRMTRRMQLCQAASVEEYLEYLQDNEDEVRALGDDLLIRVTSFFRDGEAWEALRAQVIVPLIENADREEGIRIWVPGCSSGEEAYSLAILFQEEMDRQEIEMPLSIFASDIDEEALKTARDATYPASIAAMVSEDRLQRYFRPQDSGYQLKSAIRDKIVFACHNLLRDPPFSRLHLVSCRNLLIYLGQELQEQVMALFQYACRSDGYLFLGTSESTDEQVFETVDSKHRIFKLDAKAERQEPAPPMLTSPPTNSSLAVSSSWPISRKAAAELHLEALEAAAPPSIVVDERWCVVHLSPTVSRFLEQRGGPATKQISDVVRSELRDEVHTLLHRAFADDAAQQVSQFVPVRFNGTARDVVVVARAHKLPENDGRCVLLTFLEAGESSTEPMPAESSSDHEVVRALREKLRQAEFRAERMRDDYYLANEDLRAANEELQSLNEEYHSTTEELETSKEELHSINEELQTVNRELNLKVDALSQANDDLENLMAATNIPILFLDRELSIKWFTPQFAGIFNVTAGDYGRSINDFTHRLDYDSLEEHVRSVLDKRSDLSVNATAEDGRSFIVQISPYRTEKEDAEGAVVALVDVSLIKQAEEDLLNSEEQFRALVDASAEMVWRMDEKGKIIGDSSSLAAFTGQSYEEWSTSWLAAVHPDDRATASREWEQAIRQKTDFVTELRIFHAAHQAYRWTAVRAVPLKNTDGTVREWVGMHVDVDHKRRTEEMLRETDRRKDEFLAVLGHELRNPLAAIRSNLAVFHEVDNSETQAKRVLEIVERQSQHMTRLINDLLDVVRLDRGKLQLEQVSVFVNDHIENVIETLRPAIQTADLTVRTELPEEPLYASADPDRLMQILDNLLRNAVNHTEAGGEIVITAAARKNFIEIIVRDNGLGMESDQIEVLFEPYRQADRNRSRGGLGLGLSLVSRLVNLHGGSLRASSDGIGTGSEFRFTLPVAGNQPGVETQTRPIGPLPCRRVLVVDDETDVAEAFAAMLTALGQTVTVALGGRAALDAADEETPDIAFLDISMPGMDGNQVAEHLRRQSSDTYLVALSGYSFNIREDGKFDDHLLKPASAEAVANLLRGLPA